jgi:Fic family protein
MQDLTPDAGRWRSRQVGVLRGSRVAHVAPKAEHVQGLVTELLRSLEKDRQTPLVVRACVVHYELEFIHPFSDGNGRLGRLWQHVVLLADSPVFEHVPFESIIRERQAAYHDALGRSDKQGQSTVFIDFALRALVDALSELVQVLKPVAEDPPARLERARGHFRRRWFTRKDYLSLNPTLSTATASRDLAQGVAEGQLTRQGDKALATYRFL